MDVTPLRRTQESRPASADVRSSAPPSPDELRRLILDKLAHALGKDKASATPHDWFFATALAVRDRIADCWMASAQRTDEAQTKRVYYLSIEFLIGRLLFDGLGNLGLTEPVREALAGLGVDLDDLRALEPDAALGNGGLGRLAACFMDSMASIALRLSAMASAIISGCSNRLSKMDGRRRRRIVGSTSAIRGSSSGRRSSILFISAGRLK